MSTTAGMIHTWIKECPKDKRWVLIICDTFSHEDYPAYCDAKEVREHRLKNGRNMQRIMECYDTQMDIGTQLSHQRCFNWPSAIDYIEEKTVVSSEETNTLITYAISATTGHAEYESVFNMLFQFKCAKKSSHEAISAFIAALYDIVTSEMSFDGMNKCCEKMLKKKRPPKFCPDCGIQVGLKAAKPEPEDVLEAYSDTFCRDFILNNDRHDKLEAAGIQCGWIECDQTVRFVTISGIDYLVAGIKNHSTVKIADMKIGDSKKLKF